MKQEIKLNQYHQEQNRKEAEANKKMPKASPEEFKRQSQALREHRQAQGK